MANTININIKNCCCGGGTSGGDVIEVPTEILPDPSDPEGPPDGFGEASEITGRQCKAAVFVYEWTYWLLDALVNTTNGQRLVNAIEAGTIGTVLAALGSAIIGLFGGVFASIVTAGPNIDDVLWFPLGTAFFGAGAYYIFKSLKTANVTLPLLEDALAKLPDARDMLICKMAQAASPVLAYSEIEKVLADPQYELSLSQRSAIFGLIPPWIISLLFWAADWWPSFETETLPSITETCCGTLEPGYPLLPGSVTRCDTANYVFDQLVTLFGNTHEAVTGYSAFPLIPLDVEEFIFDDIQGGHPETGDESVSIPPKIEETAYSMPQFYRGLARFMANQYTFLNLIDYLASDTTFSGLVDYFGENAESIVCSLYVALNAAEASGALLDEIAAYLLTTELSSEAQIYVNSAMVGILHADGDFINILFEQDTDVLGYSGEVACDGCGWVDPGDPSDTVFDFEISEQGWVIWEDLSSSSAVYRVRGEGYYPEADFHAGPTSGAGTARLAIYYPSLVTVDDITVYARGIQDNLGHLRIYTSDDMVEWTTLVGVEDIVADWDTPHTFEDLGIVDKYVMVYCEKFWTGANVGIRLVSFHTDGA